MSVGHVWVFWVRSFGVCFGGLYTIESFGLCLVSLKFCGWCIRVLSLGFGVLG